MADEEQRDPRIHDLIGYASNKNPVEFQNTFNDIVTDRLAQSVDRWKDAIANRVFSGPEDADLEGTEDEEEKEEGPQDPEDEEGEEPDEEPENGSDGEEEIDVEDA